MSFVRTICRLIAPTLAVAVASCAERALAPSDVQLLLRNASTDSVAFRALDRELSNRVDPFPGPAAVSSFGTQVVAPGATVVISGAAISGFRVGADVRFFLYRVSGGQANFASTFDVDATQLSARTNRVDLPRLSAVR